MKRALVLAAALFLTASIGRASILEAWCTYVTSGSPQAGDGFSHPLPAGETAPMQSDVGNLYTIQVWMEIVPDPSLGETTASIAGGGLQSAAASIVTLHGQFVTEPNAEYSDPIDYPTVVDDDFPNIGVNGLNFLRVDAARQAPNGYSDIAQSLDALQATGANRGGPTAAVRACALNSPFLFCAENWVLEQWAFTDLRLEIDPSSCHWDSTVINQEDYFSQIQTGTMINGVFEPGVDFMWVPEPATLTLLALGAAATLLRRGNKGIAHCKLHIED